MSPMTYYKRNCLVANKSKSNLSDQCHSDATGILKLSWIDIQKAIFTVLFTQVT